MPSQRISDISWTRPPQTAFRHHRLLFFRCAVTRASELFRLLRPLSRNAVVQLTRQFRKMAPHAPMTSSDPVRIFSVLNQLVPTSLVLRPEFMKNHSTWMDEALNDNGRTLRIGNVLAAAELEEDGEFLYIPSLKRCYTLVWRWLPVLVAGERDKLLSTLDMPDCIEIQGIIRSNLALHASTYLDLYPAWVEPHDAGVLFENDRRIVRRIDPSKYRFKPWEGVFK